MKELLKEDSPFNCVNIKTNIWKDKTPIINDSKTEGPKSKKLF